MHLVHDRVFFFFNDTATTEIYTLSLHDALPILEVHASPFDYSSPALASRHIAALHRLPPYNLDPEAWARAVQDLIDRKSTRLNSSHANISYAVFCLKKKKNNP